MCRYLPLTYCHILFAYSSAALYAQTLVIGSRQQIVPTYMQATSNADKGKSFFLYLLICYRLVANLHGLVKIFPMQIALIAVETIVAKIVTDANSIKNFCTHINFTNLNLKKYKFKFINYKWYLTEYLIQLHLFYYLALAQ